MYEHGQGTRKDVANAIHWYYKASSQGYIKSKLRLNSMQRSGGDAPLTR